MFGQACHDIWGAITAVHVLSMGRFAWRRRVRRIPPPPRAQDAEMADGDAEKPKAAAAAASGVSSGLVARSLATLVVGLPAGPHLAATGSPALKAGSRGNILPKERPAHVALPLYKSFQVM